MSESRSRALEIVAYLDEEITPIQAQNSLNKHILNYSASLEARIERLERMFSLPPLEKIPAPVNEEEGP